MYNFDEINKVIMFAVKAHNGQKMQYPKETDYTAHIFGVTLTALNFVDDENINKNLIMSVALLHDTIEDTNVSFEQIESEFGSEVAKGVLALTKNEELPKDKQMEECLNRILHLDKKEYAIVKLADRCFNTRCKVDTWSKEKQQNYIEESKLICEKIGKYCLPLKNKILENIARM